MENIIYPSKSRLIYCKYGEIEKNEARCNGVKFNCPLFSQVFAVEDGVVKEINNFTTKGKYIIVQHIDFCSIYANLNSIDIELGSQVKQGNVIATSGVVSSNYPPHLYFELRMGYYDEHDFWDSNNGLFVNSVDPLNYLQKSDDWRISLGLNAIKNLHEKGIISEPERWELGLLSTLPSWFIWELFNRLVNRIEIG